MALMYELLGKKEPIDVEHSERMEKINVLTNLILEKRESLGS